MKYALELIEQNANNLELTAKEIKTVDYSMPYQTDEQLIELGLIKPYTTKVRK